MTRSLSSSPPSLPPGWRAPAVVQTVRWVARPIEVMEQGARRFGDAFTVRWLGYPPSVIVSDPQIIKEVFAGDPEVFHAGEANRVVEGILGNNSLLRLDGARHLRERKLLMPPFHGERMRAYGDVMRRIAAAAIDEWPRDRVFAAQPQMQAITLDIILRTVFGLDEGPRFTRLRDLLREMLDWAVRPSLLFVLGLIPPERLKALMSIGEHMPWSRFTRAFREIDEILYAEIARRRAAGAASDGEDVLSLLVAARDEQGHPMTEVELRDEMMTLLVAGHETTATSLSWVLHHVLGRADVLDRLRLEVEHAPDGGELLDATIKEAMRLTPVVPLVGRYLIRDAALGPLSLPRGAMILPCIYLTHRRPDVWGDPERFRPDRFLDGKRRFGPHEYLPFGGGVRRCIGQAFALYEMKVVLGEVLRRASLLPAGGRAVRLERRGVTFAPSQGMLVVRAPSPSRA